MSLPQPPSAFDERINFPRWTRPFFIPEYSEKWKAKRYSDCAAMIAAPSVPPPSVVRDAINRSSDLNLTFAKPFDQKCPLAEPFVHGGDA